MAQAVRHNSSHIVTSKQTTTKPYRNESGEKKGETISETRANVRRDEGQVSPQGTLRVRSVVLFQSSFAGIAALRSWMVHVDGDNPQTVPLDSLQNRRTKQEL